MDEQTELERLLRLSPIQISYSRFTFAVDTTDIYNSAHSAQQASHPTAPMPGKDQSVTRRSGDGPLSRIIQRIENQAPFAERSLSKGKITTMEALLSSVGYQGAETTRSTKTCKPFSRQQTKEVKDKLDTSYSKPKLLDNSPPKANKSPLQVHTINQHGNKTERPTTTYSQGFKGISSILPSPREKNKALRFKLNLYEGDSTTKIIDRNDISSTKSIVKPLASKKKIKKVNLSSSKLVSPRANKMIQLPAPFMSFQKIDQDSATQSTKVSPVKINFSLTSRFHLGDSPTMKSPTLQRMDSLPNPASSSEVPLPSKQKKSEATRNWKRSITDLFAKIKKQDTYRRQATAGDLGSCSNH